MGNFKKIKSDNFQFICHLCKTRHENLEASDLKQQIEELKEAIGTLTTEFRAFKSDAKLSSSKEQNPENVAVLNETHHLPNSEDNKSTWS